MKKILFALIAGAVVLTSCSKEDEEKEKQPSELIVGTWNLDRVDYVNFENDVQVGTDTEFMDLQVKFTSNSFVAISELDTIDAGTYNISATNLNLYGDDTSNFTINSLTESQLHLYSVEEYHSDSTHYRDEGTWYFEK